MNLFRDEISGTKLNAQRNLTGRTHYVDDDTLRWHKSRILSTHITDNGLLLAIVTSDALDMNNTRRGFRYVVFDVFGTVLARPHLAEAFPTKKRTLKAMWAALNSIDAKAHTLAAAHESASAYATEMQQLRDKVQSL